MIPIKLLNIRQLEKCSWEDAKQNYGMFLDMQSDLQNILGLVLAEEGVDDRSWQLLDPTDKLRFLGKTLPRVVEGREMTTQEIQKTEEELPDIHLAVLHETKVLTKESEYVLYLVGFYIGKLLIQSNPNFEWELDKRKRSVSFKQPILRGIGVVPYQPMVIMNTLGYRIILDKVKDLALDQLYEKMENKLKGIYI